jgi:hypothetical protein
MGLTRGYGTDGNSLFAFDEARGALSIRSEHRSKVGATLNGHARRIQFHLLLKLLRLYVGKFALEMRRALLLARYYLIRPHK